MNKTARSVLSAAAVVVAAFLLRRFFHDRLDSPDFQRLFHFSHGMYAAIALLALFSVCWSIAAHDSSPTQSSESGLSRQFHVITLNLAVFLLVLPIPGLAHRFLPSGALLTALGLATEIAGILCAIWARRTLGRNWSGEVRIATGHELIRTGPYRHIRHPIYTGILGMYLGTMLVSGELHALIAFAIILILYIRKMGLEEKALSATFGAAWNAWREETWALLPPLF